MAAGNNANYVTTLGCSSGLSLNCYVEAPDGWYYDGNVGYAYYISGYSVTSIDTAPCSTPPPPAPTPAPTTWTGISLGKRSNTAAGACDFAATSYDLYYYIDTDSLTTATALRMYSDGTGNPANGYYSDGANFVNVSSGGITGRGLCSL
jgi:hypothetical protein